MTSKVCLFEKKHYKWRHIFYKSKLDFTIRLTDVKYKQNNLETFPRRYLAFFWFVKFYPNIFLTEEMVEW